LKKVDALFKFIRPNKIIRPINLNMANMMENSATTGTKPRLQRWNTRLWSTLASKHGLLLNGCNRQNGRFGFFLCAVLLAYVAIAACSLHAPFFPLDDQGELYFVRTANSWISLLGPDFYHFFRPVKNLLFAAYNWLECHGGMEAVRAVPILLGLGSAWAVFGLCCRLLASRSWALVATAAWLLAPTLVSCTAWLSCSNILVMTGFAAVALTCHDLACVSEESNIEKSNNRGRLWSVLAPLFLFLSLASYEGAVGVVPLFFVVDFYLHPARLRRPATWRLYFLYGLILVAYLALRHELGSTQKVLGSFSGVSPLHAALSSGYFTLLHAGIWLWPFNKMAVIGSYYWGQVSTAAMAACWLMVLMAGAFAFLWRRHCPMAALGIIWFLLVFAPTSNILGFRNGPYGDYYIALASVGLALTFTATLRALLPFAATGPARILALTMLSLLIVSRIASVLEAATWSRAWNDPLTVYTRNLRTFPQAFDVMIELAKCHVARREFPQADKLAAAAIRIAPDRYQAYAVRAVVAEQEGRIQDALMWLAIYRKGIPSDAWGPTFQADIYADHLGQTERAEALYREAITHRPWSQDSLRAADELAFMLATQGRRDEAISLWEESLVYNPDDGAMQHNLAIAYAQQGDQERAAYYQHLAQTNLPRSSP
jgi:tetratricopeptide (TPR) repeat protein